MDQTSPADSVEPLVSEDGQINLEALSERLGPFTPPPDFDHGPEFEPTPPRPVPKRLRTGSFGRRRWSVVLTLFVLGIGCVIFAPIPFVKKLSFHLLPLGYLDWIGYGLIATSIVVAIVHRVSKKRLNYVIDGEPLVGRILGIFTPVRTVIDPQTKTTTEFFRYLAALEYVDPDTRKLERVAVQSEDEWDLKTQPRFDPGVDAGDYVTVVRLPEQGPESVRLYGFLGLDPERDFITRDGRPLSGVSPFTAVLICLLVLTIFWFLILFLYVIECCMPREWKWQTVVPFLAVGSVAGAIGLTWLVCFDQRKQATLKRSGWIMAVLCGAVVGALAGGATLGAVNAAFDRSAPKYEPIRITQHWEKTTNFVFRTYEVEYEPFGGGPSQKHGASVDDLTKLQDAALGALEIRQGALGLEWIAGVHPVVWRSVDGEPGPEDVRDGLEVKFTPPGEEPFTVVVAPRLLLRGDEDSEELAPCPVELVEPAMTAVRAAFAGMGARTRPLRD